MKKILFFIQFLFCFVEVVKSQNNVEWVNLKSIAINNGILTKSSGIKGQATSTNMLYGSFNETFNNGALIFQSGNISNEIKTVGFTVVENVDVNFETIEYGFSFQSNKVRAYGIDGGIEQPYSGLKSFKIERANNQMNFYIDNALIYSEKVDPSEYLLIRTILRSNNAQLSNVNSTFETKRNSINPEVNQSNVISLGVSPVNNVVWEDGSKGLVSKKYVSQNYQYKIKNTQNGFLDREISIGQSPAWNELSGLTFSNGILSKNSGNNWGVAKLSTLFNSSSDLWLEYKIESQNDSKVFGVSNSSSNLSNPTMIDAGFLVGKDHLIQLYYQGSVVKSIEAFSNDIIQLQIKNNVVSYKLNGLVIYEQTLNLSNFKISALLRNNTSLKDVKYGQNSQVVTSNWDNLTYSGAININLESVNSIGNRFHYYISDNPIPDFREIYTFTRDSINGGELDSTDFYNDGDSLKQYSLNGLDIGKKYYAVFNQFGERIIGGNISIEQPLILESNQGVVLENSKRIKSNTSNAFTLTNLFFDETTENGEISFIVNETSKKHKFGLVDESDPSIIKHGVQIENRKIKPIIDGDLCRIEGCEEVIGKNAIVSLLKQLDKILIVVNGKEVGRVVLVGSGYILKAGFATEILGVGIGKGEVVSKGKPYTFNNLTELLNCENNTFDVKFKINSSKPFTYFLTNIIDGTIYPQNSQGSNNQTITYSNMQPGVYVLSGNIGTTSNPIYEIITLGYKAEFDTRFKYSLQPNSYSLNKQNTQNGILAYAITDNVLKGTETGWFKFRPILPASTNNSTYICLNNGYTNTPSGTYLKFYRPTNSTDLKYQLFVNNVQQGFPQDCPNATEFILKINQNIVQIFKNNVLQNLQFQRPIGDLNITFISTKKDEAIQDIITSFKCSEKYNQYAIPKYELDGYYHIMKKGQIMFEYVNEYNTTNLQFKILKSNSFEIKNQSDFDPVEVTFGKNYITLDVSDNDCIGKGFFILEITNQKNEKSYIRFYNDFDGCTAPIEPIDPIINE